MILFKEIYDLSIDLFDDPDIRKAYIFDKIKWQKIMYSYLENGVSLFNNPMTIAFTLVDQTSPKGSMEIFDGTGESTYTLSTVPVDGSDFSCKINGKPDSGAIYNEETNTVTFSEAVAVGTNCSIEWYFGGNFNTDFTSASTSRVSAGTIAHYVKEIIARCLVLAWAEKEKNFALDIRNLLTDTDFKIYSPANSVKAKVDWVKDLKFQLDTLQNKLAWLMFAQMRSGGRKYGP